MTSTDQPISVVMPAFNEEGGVAAQVEAIRSALDAAGVDHEVVVVDDGSVDGTARAAAAAGARVLQHRNNRGYGAALKTGIAAARHDLIGMIDADGTYPAAAIPGLIRELEQADMVVASRSGPNVNIPLVRRPGKWLLGLVANRVAGRKIPDLNSGLRVFRRPFLREYFHILPDGFSFTTTSTLALLSDGHKIAYLPIDYARRVGRSKIKPTDFFDFLILILRTAVLFEPLKVFLPSSILCLSIGMLKSIFDVVSLFFRVNAGGPSLLVQPVISTSAILFLLIGLEMLLIGMVADALIRRMKVGRPPRIPAYRELGPDDSDS